MKPLTPAALPLHVGTDTACWVLPGSACTSLRPSLASSPEQTINSSFVTVPLGKQGEIVEFHFSSEYLEASRKREAALGCWHCSVFGPRGECCWQVAEPYLWGRAGRGTSECCVSHWGGEHRGEGTRLLCRARTFPGRIHSI